MFALADDVLLFFADSGERRAPIEPFGAGTVSSRRTCPAVLIDHAADSVSDIDQADLDPSPVDADRSDCQPHAVFLVGEDRRHKGSDFEARGITVGDRGRHRLRLFLAPSPPADLTLPPAKHWISALTLRSARADG